MPSMASALPAIANGSYAVAIHHAQRNERPRGGRIASGATYAIACVASGAAIVTSEGVSTRHLAPFVLLLPPGREQWVDCPAASEWEEIRFDVVATPLRPVGSGPARTHVLPRVQPPPMAVWGCEPPALVPDHLVANCIETVRFCGRHWWLDLRGQALADARLQWWLTDYATAFLPEVGNRDRAGDHWLAEVLAVAEAGLASGMTGVGLARALGISRESLRMRLATVSRWTPGQLLANMRMERAVRLLGERPCSLDEVRRRCGFRSPAAFSRAFTRRYGVPPGAWRRYLSHSLSDWPSRVRGREVDALTAMPFT